MIDQSRSTQEYSRVRRDSSQQPAHAPAKTQREVVRATIPALYESRDPGGTMRASRTTNRAEGDRHVEEQPGRPAAGGARGGRPAPRPGAAAPGALGGGGEHRRGRGPGRTRGGPGVDG